jgi:hypothetical protein
MMSMHLMGLVAVLVAAALSCAPSYMAVTGTNHPADPRAQFGPEEPSSKTLHLSEAPPKEVMLGGHAGHGDHNKDMGGHTGHGENKKDMGGHTGHGGHSDDGGHPKEAGDHADKGTMAPSGVDPTEWAAYLKAKPVFVKYCSSCHTPKPDAKEQEEAWEHFTMDRYPFGGHHASELGKTIRKSVGIDGDDPTMPDDDPGLVEGDELELIAAWSRAFDKARAGTRHEHGHGHKMKKKAPNKHDHGH